jgi:DNA polymerase III alpha subunit
METASGKETIIVLRRLLAYSEKIFQLSKDIVTVLSDRREKPRISTAAVVKSSLVLFWARMGSSNAWEQVGRARFWQRWLGEPAFSADTLGRVHALLDAQGLRQGIHDVYERLKRNRALAVLVHDAQLHGLRVKPINALQSEWNCTIERTGNKQGKEVPCLRIGLRYVHGLRQSNAGKLVCERKKLPFEGIDDLVRRVPELQKSELVTLSEIGALNSFGKGLHRRTALWQVERAARPAGPLLDVIPEQMELSPLQQMTDEERLVADFHGSGMSTGPHPMSYCREALSKQQVKRACDLSRLPAGQYTRVAGCVIARQRPGTAKGFVFLSLEGETGIANVIVNPDLYEKYRVVINREKFLRVDGVLQNQDHTISIKASNVQPISITAADTQSHDFH